MQLRRVFAFMFLVSSVTCIAPGAPTTAPADGPVLPVGLDAYRMWEQWPMQRIGQRAYMRSTYDRSGGNEGADASHFLYQKPDGTSVSLDVAGPGVLYFVRTNHWHGSPWHYVVDGADHIVKETSTASPTRPAANSVFQPEAALPKPLTFTWADTKGADLNWVPIGFEKSFQMAYGRTRYGTGYYIFDQFVPGARLSQPIKAWDGATPPDADVLALINKAGTDLAPRPGTPEGDAAGLKLVEGKVDVPADGAVDVAKFTSGPSLIRAIEFTAPNASAIDFGRVRLRVTWDGRAEPSIDAPVGLFHGAGTLYNRDGREYLVKAFPVHVRYAADTVHLACYFPMPFFRSAHLELVGAGAAVKDVNCSIRYVPYTGPTNAVGYFHATYRDFPDPAHGEDLTLLDTRKTEGGGDWTGSFVGTSFIFSHNANLNTLEGDPRFYFDDSNTPQAQGTGTEEWGGGGDYWGGRNMTLPFAGHPTGAQNANAAKSDEDKIESAYRFLLADLFPFGKNARITLEHGGTNESKEHYETVTFWYGLPGASLVPTDELSIGNKGSETSHHYVSPDASEPYTITSRYEWGVDHAGGKEIFPATPDLGRKTTSASEFNVAVQPDNLGVLLRRKLDYQFPNQRAEVSIADVDKAGNAKGTFRPAGTWYTAGSNVCVYSNPPGELDDIRHDVRTSNRRFRDDEFLLGPALTDGRRTVRVRVKFVASDVPLFPDHPQGEQAWSEIRYWAYSFVAPTNATHE